MSAIISDAYLHAIRTAAPYGVAAKYLARKGARTLGIIGSGRYARGMAQAVCAVCPIETIQVYSRNPDNVRSFVTRCARRSASRWWPARRAARLCAAPTS